MILSPGGTIGILGAGQLGRMLAIAALKVGLRTHIFAPEREAPWSWCVKRQCCGSKFGWANVGRSQ